MRAKSSYSIISIVLSLLMVLSVISFPTIKAKAAGTVDDFVERCYTVILNRPSEKEGFEDWKDQLVTGKSVGAQVAYGFVFSKEYKGRNRTNEEYVNDLYKLFMDRDPDEGGFNDWAGKLNSGVSREEVYVGFVNSQEFYNICDSYGITAGAFYLGYDRNQVNNVNLFVDRLYDTCLGRRGDRKGQQDWVKKLLNKEISGIECARCFVQSKEYINKNLSNEEYVENMYKAMMGRASDAEGKANWVNALSSGTKTRDEVFAGFANSKEFGNICAEYKIDKGSYTAKDIAKPKEEKDKRFRITKKTYSCGDYTILEYQNQDDNCLRATRFDKNGKFKGYETLIENINTQDGQLVRTVNEYFYDDGVKRNDHHSERVYNSDGTVETEYIYLEDWKTLDKFTVYEKEKYQNNGSVSMLIKKSTTYDANANMTEYTVYKYDGTKTIEKTKYNSNNKVSQIDIYEYYNKSDSEKKDIKKSTSIRYDSDGKEEYKYIREYYENGIDYKLSTFYSGKLDNYSVDEYDATGKKIRYTFYTSYDSPILWGMFDYDANGNVIKESVYNTEKMLNHTDYTYDSNNNLLSQTRYDSEGKITDSFKFEYNKDGKVIKEVMHFPEYDSQTEYTYEYDKYGNQTKLTRTYNGEVNYWVINQWSEY